MASSPSPAPAPDYAGAAQETAAGNMANLQYQTQANRVDQNNPWGSSTWSQGTNADGTPNNHWTQTTSLTPQLQSALDSQLSIQQNQSSLAKGLQGQVASTMADGFHAPQYSTASVPSVNSNFAAFDPSGVNGVSQTFGSGAQNLNTNAAGAVAGAGAVNLNAPQFSDATAQAGAQSAYNASHSLVADQQAQQTSALDAQLRNQGLTPGTTAYDNAMQNELRVQAQQNDNLASQSVLTGNQMALGNYNAQLAGFDANLGAQQQAYGQAANTFNLGNTALASQYGLDQNTFNTNNAAQQQAFTQRLGTYGANTNAQQQSNAAQGQAYGQNLQNYQTLRSGAYQDYMTPLNSLNAVLGGNQVGMPSFANYTTAGYTPGADYSGAASAQGQYNSGVSAQNAANASSTNGMITGLGSAAIMALAMY